MRNPVRSKNLKPRLWPVWGAGAVALAGSAPAPESVLAGLPLVLLGVAIRSWGAGHLVKNELLVCSGPYAYVRHPFYLGTLAIGTGFAVMLGGPGTWLGLAILLPWFFVSYFPRKERVEAHRLAAIYGEAFERYRDAVPALLPARGRYPDGAATRWSWARYDGNNELGTLLACLAGLGIVAAWVWLRG